MLLSADSCCACNTLGITNKCDTRNLHGNWLTYVCNLHNKVLPPRTYNTDSHTFPWLKCLSIQWNIWLPTSTSIVGYADDNYIDVIRRFFGWFSCAFLLFSAAFFEWLSHDIEQIAQIFLWITNKKKNWLLSSVFTQICLHCTLSSSF